MTHPLRQLLKQAMLATLPRGAFVARARGSRVCLTFDDGPDPELTPRLLDVLSACGVVATFFVIGERAERHPRLIERMARAGHEIGSHSFRHTPPSETTTATLADETRRCNALLTSITGRPPTLTRPPYGELTPGKLIAMWRLQQTVVLWNIDPKDYQCNHIGDLAAHFAATPLAAGDLVLLHDVYPWAARTLPPAIREAHDRGLRFTTVSDAL